MMNLVFLTYINRSGSTFLANKLSELSDILVCPEAEILLYHLLIEPCKAFYYDQKTESKFIHFLKTDRKLKFWKLEKKDLVGLKNMNTNFEAFLEILKAYRRKTRPNANTIVFKATKLIDIYEKIRSSAQDRCEVKFISLVRDGRAAYSSQRKTIDPYTRKRMNTNPILAGRLWSNFIEKTLIGKKNKWFNVVLYEELILNFKKCFSKLIDYLGVPENVENKFRNDLYNRMPKDQKQMHQNVKYEGDEKNIDNWRFSLSSLQIYLFEKQAANCLVEFDYLLVHPKVKVLILFVVEIFYRLKYSYWKLRHK